MHQNIAIRKWYLCFGHNQLRRSGGTGILDPDFGRNATRSQCITTPAYIQITLDIVLHVRKNETLLPFWKSNTTSVSHEDVVMTRTREDFGLHTALRVRALSWFIPLPQKKPNGPTYYRTSATFWYSGSNIIAGFKDRFLDSLNAWCSTALFVSDRECIPPLPLNLVSSRSLARVATHISMIGASGCHYATCRSPITPPNLTGHGHSGSTVILAETLR
ncbi:hypothetical protein BD410DRAFT_832951 [Rickenella mellea]|uniref:Uncharacterized protein n=1 Tax=Rickenella mellea TaxID=50990 RepID=A0A4Y7PIE2_9AGAM|nr:hypothetical protein BD410DRAFT_832951 [Rickenella mellea]